MKQTPESDRSVSRSCRINSGSTPDRLQIGVWIGLWIGLNSTGFDRSQPNSIGVLRIQSEYSGAPECSGIDQSTPELWSRIRNYIGFEVSFQHVDSEWIREFTPEFPSLCGL
uniref:Uncharacterized protein n=1 Tax=Anopheles maculatus TaxID=74869 RepID=A0A182SN60_9DIPT